MLAWLFYNKRSSAIFDYLGGQLEDKMGENCKYQS